MAKKQDANPKITLERTYNVPLRKEFQKAPKYRRAKKAGMALRQFLSKHMKSDTVKIGRHLNMKLWKNGIKNPPHHVNVAVKKFDDGVVEAELVGAPVDKKESKPKKAETKKVEPEKKAEEAKPKVEAKPAVVPAEKPVEKKAPETKEEPKKAPATKPAPEPKKS
jgi:large subunit ribosomal protein L31e